MSKLLVLIITGAAWHRAGGRCNDEDPSVHAFYYLWYGAPSTDGRYLHWDHRVLPHWEARIRERYPPHGDAFEPPTWLHSPYYPALGPYSSKNATTLATHFNWMKGFGIDVAVLSWTGRGDVVSDTQGVRTDEAFPLAIEAATKAGVGVAVHLEPYEGRSPETVREDLRYLLGKYGRHLAQMRLCDADHGKPIVYIYDAYHSAASDWAALLAPDSPSTIRGTDLDVVAIATVLTERELDDLAVAGGFDGVYTYFATDGFTWGSTTRHWPDLTATAKAHNLLVSLSVGPGYNDTRIRPWNDAATRPRNNGTYFRHMLDAAAKADPDIISVTSFNEWGEGTQIEPALVPGVGDDDDDHDDQRRRRLDTHLDYGGQRHRFRYLDKLAMARASWVSKRRQDIRQEEERRRAINDEL